MKKVIYSIVAISVLSLTSCGGWSSSDKETYMSKCKEGGMDEKLCQCMLDKLVEKYKDPNEAKEAMEKDMKAAMDIAKGCL
jgi:hypothetical protein